MKRLFDLFFVTLTAPVWLPSICVLYFVVRAGLGTPVFFTQPRVGLGGRIFRLRKFRTMTDARDAAGRLLPDAQRLTRLGRFLRSTSLDEFASVVNVIRGDMSIVGPRPLLVEYLPLYSARQARRHEVVPGVTGWAQIHGRNAQTWEERFEYDVWYVEHRSLWLDIRILARTFGKVFRREGVSASGHVTMEPFRGSERSGA
jgi:lipopolysaccharide/colanic/teichoic acid biosynthesis glycosyltransferase